MNQLIFTSELSSEYKDELQHLVFFNAYQCQFESIIEDLIEHYGSPRLCVENEKLRIRIEGQEDVQSLYVLEAHVSYQRLVGVVIYSRIDTETLALLHLSVTEDYACSGKHAESMLPLRFISKLRQIARQICGIQKIYFFYNSINPCVIHVH